MKFNPLTSAIKGKRLVVVDDSIVRGNTTEPWCGCSSRRGPRKCTCASRSPPIVFPCFYGIDMANQDEFIAFSKSVDDVSRGAGGDLRRLSVARGPDAGHRRGG